MAYYLCPICTGRETHAAVSGRKYTPITRYTSSKVGAIQIGKSDGKVSQNDRNGLFFTVEPPSKNDLLLIATCIDEAGSDIASFSRWDHNRLRV